MHLLASSQVIKNKEQSRVENGEISPLFLRLFHCAVRSGSALNGLSPSMSLFAGVPVPLLLVNIISWALIPSLNPSSPLYKTEWWNLLTCSSSYHSLVLSWMKMTFNITVSQKCPFSRPFSPWTSLPPLPLPTTRVIPSRAIQKTTPGSRSGWKAAHPSKVNKIK